MSSSDSYCSEEEENEDFIGMLNDAMLRKEVAEYLGISTVAVFRFWIKPRDPSIRSKAILETNKMKIKQNPPQEICFA